MCKKIKNYFSFFLFLSAFMLCILLGYISWSGKTGNTAVVYFNQLLGAAGTRKLFKTLFCRFQPFLFLLYIFSDFSPEIKKNVYWLNIPYYYFKFNSTYFMAYCIESLLQPFSNWKFNWRWRDLKPVPSEYQSNTLLIELSRQNYK